MPSVRSRFVWANVNKHVLSLDDPTFFVGIIHSGNTSRKQTHGSRWHSYPAASIRELMGDSHEVTA